MRNLWKVSIPSLEGDFIVYLDDASTFYQHLHSAVGSTNVDSFRALAGCWVSLLGDSPLSLKPHRVINQFLHRFTEDPLGVLRDFGASTDELLSSLHVGADGDTIIPFCPLMRGTPVFKEFLTFMETHDPILLRYIVSFLEFGKRVPYVNPDLDAVAFRGWLEVEDRISELDIDAVASNLKPIVEYVLRAWGCDDFFPGHGPGAVANQGVRSLADKCDNFEVSPSVNRAYFDSWLTADRDYYPSPDGALPKIDHDRTPSALIFVPKSWKTSRSICMEPVGTQWAQQAVRRWLEKSIADGPLRHHVVLDDQSVNRSAALWSSLTQGCATLDLSSASDSVSWELVKSVFPTRILLHLAATRTSKVTVPDGSIRAVHKFAPMGSAVCFPVQSILYSCIIAMIDICDAYGLDWRVAGSVLTIASLDIAWQHCYAVRDAYDYTSRYFPFKVFGDDLLVDNTSVSNIEEALTLLGFKLNMDKSFIEGSAYRESCGMHAFHGVDVTPLRFKVKQCNPRLSAVALASLVDFANRAREYGYATCRRHAIRLILWCELEDFPSNSRSRPNPILFIEDSDVSRPLAIRTDEARNTHLVRRKAGDPHGNVRPWFDFQKSYFLSLNLIPADRDRLSIRYDNYRYVRWWASAQVRQSRDICTLYWSSSRRCYVAYYDDDLSDINDVGQVTSQTPGSQVTLSLGWTPRS